MYKEKKEKLDRSQLIGITESSDIAFNLDAFDNLYDGNIIITKRLTNALIDKLIEHKDKIILHLTVTGYGGTKIEPFVPKYEVTYKKFKTLLEKGFPIEQCVLRVDPIVPTNKGFLLACRVIKTFCDTGIKRVRFSILDMYDHVKERFKEADIDLPYETFHAPLEERDRIMRALIGFGVVNKFEVEACGEPGLDSIPCLSQKDIDILGLTDKITLVGSADQRSNCHCPSNKKELLTKNKAKRCENKCVYCFWRD